jgi:hypothetical protein
VAVEGGSIDMSSLANGAYCYIVKPLLNNQLHEGVADEGLGTAHTRVAVLRHFLLLCCKGNSYGRFVD